MKIFELKDLFFYGLEELGQRAKEIMAAFKKPKLWAYVCYSLFFYAVLSNKLILIKLVLPMIFLIYLIRLKIDGKYRKISFERDLLKNRDTYIVKEYYESYLKQQTMRIKPIDTFEEWKKKKINEFYKNNKHNDSFSQQ
jgi:hypothetical protein